MSISISRRAIIKSDRLGRAVADWSLSCGLVLSLASKYWTWWEWFRGSFGEKSFCCLMKGRDGNTHHFLQQKGENGIEISVVGVKMGKQSFEGLWCLSKKSSFFSFPLFSALGQYLSAQSPFFPSQMNFPWSAIHAHSALHACGYHFHPWYPTPKLWKEHPTQTSPPAAISATGPP